ncbi:MAG: beta-lactamase family protein [Anaerolineae bacterium]|nr:beta-lactamase family protein [Anaerolineae bacterium]
MSKTDVAEQVGMSAERLARISVLLRRYVEQQTVAGIVATVARRGQTVYLEKFGYADLEAGEPMACDTIFRIASMTKPITAVAAMMLYEEGWFDLNTFVHEFIPAFKDLKVFVRQTKTGPELAPLAQPITFRHLFTHTAGLSYGFDPQDPIDRLYNEAGATLLNFYAPDGRYTNKDVVDALVKLPLAFQPGTRWRYSLSIDVLGYLVELISGKPLDVFFKERIFEPLGMADTDFYVPADKLPRVAKIYCTDPSGAGLARVNLPVPTAPPAFLSGGGGLFSTIGDYGRFAQMLVNGGELDGVRLLSPHTVRLMEMNQAPAQALPYEQSVGSLKNAGYGYGLGMRVLTDVAASGRAGSVGEFGWDGAFATYFWVDRTEALYGLLMTQHQAWSFPLHQQFKILTYQALTS